MGKPRIRKDVKDVILEKLERKGEISQSDVIEELRPYFEFDSLYEKERALKRHANSLIKSIIDKEDERCCYALQESGKTTYIDIDKNKDVDTLFKIEHSLKIKQDGINKSRKKIMKRITTVSQMTIDQWQNDQLNADAN